MITPATKPCSCRFGACRFDLCQLDDAAQISRFCTLAGRPSAWCGPGCGSVEWRLAWWLARGCRWDLSREHRGVRGHERIGAGGGGRAARRCLAGLRAGRLRRWVQVVVAFAERLRVPRACKDTHGAPCHARTLSIAPPGQPLLGCRELPG